MEENNSEVLVKFGLIRKNNSWLSPSSKSILSSGKPLKEYGCSVYSFRTLKGKHYHMFIFLVMPSWGFFVGLFFWCLGLVFFLFFFSVHTAESSFFTSYHISVTFALSRGYTIFGDIMDLHGAICIPTHTYWVLHVVSTVMGEHLALMVSKWGLRRLIWWK